MRFDPVAGFSFAALTLWAWLAVAPGSCVVSDGLLGFDVRERLGYTHTVVLAPRGKAGTDIAPFRWLNVLLAKLKTALSGTHHAFKFAKYARRYLAEVQYRFNRRADLAAMVPRLAVAVAQTRPCPSWYFLTRFPTVYDLKMTLTWFMQGPTRSRYPAPASCTVHP